MRFLSAVLLAAFTLLGGVRAQTEAPPAPARPGVDGVWQLEKLIYAAAAVTTRGGFIFLDGHYSATVNYEKDGTQTNISQFGTYSLQGNHLAIIPEVHVSTRGQTIIYQPEPPFTLEITVTGNEMRGVATKDGTTFLFRRTACAT
jgi:hypothetical protein